MTKIERAIAQIAKHGRVRSPEIATHLGIDLKNVAPLLFDAVQRGYLLSCKVERPGQSPINEYCLSAAAAPDGSDYATFKAEQRARRSIEPARQPAPRVTAPARVEPSADTPPASAKSDAPPPMAPDAAPSHAPACLVTHVAEYIEITLDNKANLVIACGDQRIAITPPALRILGNFLLNTQGAWA